MCNFPVFAWVLWTNPSNFLLPQQCCSVALNSVVLTSRLVFMFLNYYHINVAKLWTFIILPVADTLLSGQTQFGEKLTSSEQTVQRSQDQSGLLSSLKIKNINCVFCKLCFVILILEHVVVGTHQLCTLILAPLTLQLVTLERSYLFFQTKIVEKLSAAGKILIIIVYKIPL